MEGDRKLIRSVALTVGVRLLIVVAALISSILTARLLGPEGRGVFFYWSMIAGTAMQLGNLGLHSSNTYYLAREPGLLGELAANALLCAVALGVLTLPVLVVIELARGTLGNSWPMIWPTAILAASGLYFLLGTNLLVALNRLVAFNLFEVSNRCVAVVLIALAAWAWGSANAALVAAAAASLLVCVPLLAHINAISAPPRRPNLALFHKGIGYALRAYTCGLISFMVLRASTFVLERFVGQAELGSWSISVQMLDMINILPMAVGIVLLPRILLASEPYAMMLKSLGFVAVAMLGAVVGTVFLGEFIIDLLYGRAFSDSYPILLWGLPGAVCLGLLSVASQFLASAGIPPSLIGVWAIGLVVEVGAAFVLVPIYGPSGGMMAFSVGHIVVLGMAWWLVQVQRRREHEFNFSGNQTGGKP